MQSLHISKFYGVYRLSYDLVHSEFELELVFIKQYVPSSLRLTVNSHHVLFVKMLTKFSKGHNSGKNKINFFFFLNLIR